MTARLLAILPCRPISRFLSQNLIVCFIWLASFSFTFSNSVAEIRWSADGTWLAYRQVTRSDTIQRLEAGWLFDPEKFATANPSISVTPAIHQLWIGRADLKAWRPLASASLFLSNPAWAADNRSIFYAGVEQETSKKFFWRVRQVRSISNGQPKSDIIWEKPLPYDWLPPAPGSRGHIVLSEMQAGPEGLLVFADPLAQELVLFRADSRDILVTFPQGHFARIHPNAGFVAWLRTEAWPPTTGELMLTKLPDGLHSTHLKNILPHAAPQYSADGQAVYIARHQKPPGALSVPAGSDWPEIARVELKQSKATRYSQLVSTPVLPTEELASLSFSLNNEEVLLVYSPFIRPRPTEIIWFQPKTAATYKRFPAMDFRVPAHHLALSRDDTLALRLGPVPQHFDTSETPAGLCDLLTEQVLPFVPDQYAQKSWVDLLARTILEIIQKDTVVSAAAKAEKQARFSFIPDLEKLPPDGPVTLRLRRVANVGLRSLGLDPKKVDARKLQGMKSWEFEAAALFLILTNHHAEALESLKLIPDKSFSPVERGRRLAAIAQEEITLGNRPEAAMILDLLYRTEPNFLGSIESDGQGGMRLGPVTTSPWLEHLKSLEKLSLNTPRMIEGRSPMNPLGHFNPDDPENDPDLKLQQPKPIAP